MGRRGRGELRRDGRLKRTGLVVEYVGLFAGLPLLYRSGLVPLPLLPSLWLLAAGCLLALLASRGFDRTRLWNTEHLGRRLRRAALPCLLALPPLFVATAIFETELLFRFVRQRPLLWAAVMVLYPILSVYPQGIVYRVFIFHRYRAVFGEGKGLILASACAFAAVHIVFRNWLAPPLSLAGGLLFAWTYRRTNSALVAGVQHALFGCALFTIGLGWYFYRGSAE